MLLQTTIDIRDQFNQQNLYPDDLAEHSGDTGAALGGIITKSIDAIIIFAAIAVLLYFIWAGISWLTAGGNKDRVEGARDRIVNAIIGMALVASAFAIYQIVDRFFGIGNLSNSRPASSSTSSTSNTTSCGGGLNLGKTGTFKGTTYQCVAPGTPCGSGNPNGFNYPFNCPVQLVNNPNLSPQDAGLTNW